MGVTGVQTCALPISPRPAAAPGCRRKWLEPGNFFGANLPQSWSATGCMAQECNHRGFHRRDFCGCRCRNPLLKLFPKNPVPDSVLLTPASTCVTLPSLEEDVS